MDPYKVLGVNPDDDEETIKKAYRKLVKKYHPDRYVNTPMQDMANEKIKEINEAYDMITNKKTSSGYNTNPYGNPYGNWGGYGGYTNTNFGTSFESVRMLIRLRRLAEAEAMLTKLPQNAEWYYLMGLIYINRGWYDKGKEYIKTATQKDPQNPEYARTLASFEARGGGYREFNTEFVNCCPTSDLLPCLCGSFICSRFFCCC